jgi:hypothetical protein|tara:strand:+ start:82 stop:978 length:897 start_codon:yes stop_codon:yes gene_type:complete
MTVTNLKAKPITSSQSLRKQIEILNYHIKNAPTHSIVITFTPELAEYILTNYNKNNRPLKHGKIIEYANYMTDTKWLLTGATLVFGSDGLLKDGQNRLASCLRANVNFTSHVVFGIDPKAFTVMDIGANRSPSDILAIMGVKNHIQITASLKLYMAWKEGKTNTGVHKVTNEEIRKFFINNADESAWQRAIKFSKDVYRTTNYPQSMLGALYYWAFENNEEKKLIKFYEELRDGYGKARSPQKMLMKHINQMKNDRFYKITSHEYAVILTRAWYNYKNNKLSSKADIVVGLDDRLPLI